MKRNLTVAAVVLGVALLILGLTGYDTGRSFGGRVVGRGWTQVEQAMMALGAALAVGGLLLRR